MQIFAIVNEIFTLINARFNARIFVEYTGLKGLIPELRSIQADLANSCLEGPPLTAVSVSLSVLGSLVKFGTGDQ